MAKFSKENQPAKRNVFSSTNQPENRGRKPKFLKRLKRAYTLDRDEFEGVCQHLLCCTKSELESIMENDDTPLFVINIAKAIYMDIKAGKISTVKDLCNMFWGGKSHHSETLEITESTRAEDASRRITVEIIDRRAIEEAEVIEDSSADGRREDTDQ